MNYSVCVLPFQETVLWPSGLELKSINAFSTYNFLLFTIFKQTSLGQEGKHKYWDSDQCHLPALSNSSFTFTMKCSLKLCFVRRSIRASGEKLSFWLIISACRVSISTYLTIWLPENLADLLPDWLNKWMKNIIICILLIGMLLIYFKAFTAWSQWS